MSLLNQSQVVKRRKVFNIVLTLIFMLLLVWVVYLLQQAFNQKNQTANSMIAVNKIHIQRQGEVIALSKQNNNHWEISKPYQSKASTAVIDALLSKLHIGCQSIDASALSKEIQYYAHVITNQYDYHVGELNPATDRVYVLRHSLGSENINQALADTKAASLWLCDKLVASIALAPAINFIDKSLYSGRLLRLQGSFGQVSDFTGIDLSVLELVSANDEEIQSATLSDLTFVSDEQTRTYQVLPAKDNSQHLMLYDATKSLIYVIASHPKLTSIIGL